MYNEIQRKIISDSNGMEQITGIHLFLFMVFKETHVHIIYFDNLFCLKDIKRLCGLVHM
jgi:hypothetical protein